MFDRTENYSGGNRFPTRQAPRAVSGSAYPPRARSRVRYHQGIFLALQRSNTGGLPSIRSYRKLFWGKSFPHSPGSQSCLWERFPPESALSGPVPSRHLLEWSTTEGLPSIRSYRNLFWGKSFPHSPGSQSCLWERFPPESTLSGSVPSRHLLGTVAV